METLNYILGRDAQRAKCVSQKRLYSRTELASERNMLEDKNGLILPYLYMSKFRCNHENSCKDSISSRNSAPPGMF